MSNIIGISALQFVHVKDLNTNITRVELGPQTVVLGANEQLAAGPLPMIVVPPGHYCAIKDPMSNYEHGKRCELKLGQYDIRFHSEPFCLYPGESLVKASTFGAGSTDYSPAISKQPVIKADHALCLKAVLDHTDQYMWIKRNAGDLWHLEGPLLYRPTPNCTIEYEVQPQIIKQGCTLLLRAKEDFQDKLGKDRITGEMWYMSKPGSYLPTVHEEVVDIEEKTTLTVDMGLILRAEQTLTDSRGINRLAGEEWLLTGEEEDCYYPEIGVTKVSIVSRKVLKQGQFCVVMEPVDKSGRPQYGKRELRRGCCSFFLHPGESLEKGIQNNYILSEDQALLLQAMESFQETNDKGKVLKRKCGERWLLNGPVLYVPPIQVDVMAKRSKIPLSKNEGIYVQDVKTGQVRSVMGPNSYMLKEYEELWKKELSPELETMLKQGGGMGSSGDIRKLAYFEQSVDPSVLKGRDKTRVITYRCPGNTAVQVSNFVDKESRVIFGPDLVILGSHETFNILSLSAGKPKKPDALKTICLMLGPDFISDILVVETSDHARLRLQVAFDNHFEYDKNDTESAAKLFGVPDFIGFACRCIGSKIRAAVALTTFDEFHRHSSQVIKTAVFQNPKTGKIDSQFKFDVNNLVISAIDIQSIEPVDTKMRDSLSKSIQLAIEISTNSIEASARHEAMRTEQEAKGHLERQKLRNEMDAEDERCKLLELQAVTAAVESTGQAKAEAQAHAEKALIEGQSEIEAAKLKAHALQIEHSCKLETQNMLRCGELGFTRSQIQLDLTREKALAEVEVNKFSQMVEAIGADTLAAIATAGPETKLKMLSALGLSSTLITDGSSPINLFNTADGFIGAQ